METLKTQVREKYGEIATQSSDKKGCGCGCNNSNIEYSMIGDEYDNVEGYVADADLGLGCGIPTDLAGIQPGQTVLDLGSGAGLDVFVARKIVGDEGRVIGVDMTPEMVAKARQNAEKHGFTNVQFLLGDIEALPIESATIDVIISNCVLNLVPDKQKAFAEIYRALKPGGHFTVSDIVLKGELPEAIQKAAEMYVGCVSGAMQQDEYMDIIRATGFQEVAILKQNAVPIPKEELAKLLSPEEVDAYYASGTEVLSVTISGIRNL